MLRFCKDAKKLPVLPDGKSCVIGSVNIGDFSALNALNAQAGGIGDRDLLLVEHRAAENGILAAQYRAVQIHLCDDIFGAA